MGATDAVVGALDRNWTMVDTALADMSDADLARIPVEGCNSMAWILWHFNRTMDIFSNAWIQSIPQIWVRDGWHAKFGMPGNPVAKPDDMGVGWTAEQVAAWVPPPQEILIGYFHAVRSETREYLASLTLDDLEHVKIIPPLADPRPVSSAVSTMVFGNIAHGGQIAYLRGFFQGMGWWT